MEYIFQNDMKDYLFEKLVKAGLAPNDDDLDVITEIVFDYLEDRNILDIVEYDEFEDEED
jgi:hypothetical protein